MHMRIDEMTIFYLLPRLTRHTRSLSCSNRIGIGKKRWITAALTGHQRQRQRRAQDLSATLPFGSINSDPSHQSSGRTPWGAIFTSLGSNWPRMVTRSFCAAITWWMFL